MTALTAERILRRHRPSQRGIREAMRDQMHPRYVEQLLAMYVTQTVPRRGAPRGSRSL